MKKIFTLLLFGVLLNAVFGQTANPWTIESSYHTIMQPMHLTVDGQNVLANTSIGTWNDSTLITGTQPAENGAVINGHYLSVRYGNNTALDCYTVCCVDTSFFYADEPISGLVDLGNGFGLVYTSKNIYVLDGNGLNPTVLPDSVSIPGFNQVMHDVEEIVRTGPGEFAVFITGVNVSHFYRGVLSLGNNSIPNLWSVSIPIKPQSITGVDVDSQGNIIGGFRGLPTQTFPIASGTNDCHIAIITPQNNFTQLAVVSPQFGGGAIFQDSTYVGIGGSGSQIWSANDYIAPPDVFALNCRNGALDSVMRTYGSNVTDIVATDSSVVLAVEGYVMASDSSIKNTIGCILATPLVQTSDVPTGIEAEAASTKQNTIMVTESGSAVAAGQVIQVHTMAQSAKTVSIRSMSGATVYTTVYLEINLTF